MLDAFFTPVNKSLAGTYSGSTGTLGAELKIYTSKFPNPNSIDVAIIGLGKNADFIRPFLYSYAFNFSGITIADFGNLNHDGSKRNMNAGMSECIIALAAHQIIPLFIGENENCADALVKSNSFLQVDYALVSPLIEFNTGDSAFKFKQKKKLFHASFVGIQNFLNMQTTLQLSAETFSENLRLSELRNNLSLVEPMFREADFFEFNLSAIKQSDFSSSENLLPSGLFNQEACTICRYAGLSNRISIYLLNHFKLKKELPTDHMQVAQMAWYILDGISNRFNDHPQVSNRNFTVYKCHAHSGEDTLFLNSELTGRWWMQVPVLEKTKKTVPKFIGCNENDFEIAKQGEIPEKWFRALGYH